MAKLTLSMQRGLQSAARDMVNSVGHELPVEYDGLTQKERVAVRERYVEDQDGLCYHCECPLDEEPPSDIRATPINWSLFPGERSFLKHPVHLHHCHTTGLTLGAVHALCNAVLWQHHGE